jgi:hypothetical protein
LNLSTSEPLNRKSDAKAVRLKSEGFKPAEWKNKTGPRPFTDTALFLFTYRFTG